MDITQAIPLVRESVVAIMHFQLVRPARKKKGKIRPARFKAAFVGTGFCVVADRFVLTAHHVLKARPKGTLAFTVPANGDTAYHFPSLAARGESRLPGQRPSIDLPHGNGQAEQETSE